MGTWKKLAYYTDIAGTNLANLSGIATEFLNGTGAFSVPAGGGLTSAKISFTRSLAAASGDVQYTGAGFKPTVIIALATLTSMVHSVGFSDSQKQNACVSTNLGAILGGSFLIYANSATDYQRAIVKSYDADGFTLTWTKVGSPYGTFFLYFLCLK